MKAATGTRTSELCDQIDELVAVLERAARNLRASQRDGLTPRQVGELADGFCEAIKQARETAQAG